MKAKIAPRKEVVLLYRQEQVPNGAFLLELLEQMKIECRLVTEDQLGKTTGELAGYRSASTQPEQAEVPVPQVSAMAMGGLAGKRLDELLNAMSKAGVEIPIKMVVTQHNENWKFGELIEEVSREHELFMSMERLKRLVTVAQKQEASSGQLTETLKKARAALTRMQGPDQKQPDRQELDSLSEQLQGLL
jgi:hypothetical protein